MDGLVVAELEDASENNHASILTVLIAEVLKMASVKKLDLSAIAVSAGPGSYTGLRIGASVAKGLCYGLDIPLIGVSTLHGLAHTMSACIPDEKGVYISAIDARRDDIYYAIYDANDNLIEADSFCTVNEAFAEKLKGLNSNSIYMNETVYLKLQKICLNNEFGTVIENIILKASNIKDISFSHYIKGQYESSAYFEPFYLKEFEGRMKIN
jgi:tRNA threonylcarbamoyladenosine biosynthesis protein TsaB